MKLLGVSRLPFLGLAVTAAVAISLSDFVSLNEHAVLIGLILIGIPAAVLLYRPNLPATYLLVFSSFFLLHSLQTTATPGLTLVSLLGDRPRVITATGAIVSEPKMADNGITSFLLRLSSIELEGQTKVLGATMSVRWRGGPAFGDELRLFGMAVPVAPPRNPGEFDMRAYLARRDVQRV